MRISCVALSYAASLLVLLSTNTTAAQNTRSSATDLKVAIDLVLLDVAVHDKEGNTVTTLRQEDFAVFEDKVEQRLSFLSREESPVTWGLVLDRSGSMDGAMRDVYESAVHILQEGTNENEMFIMTFGDRVELVSKLTSDRRKLRDAIFGLMAHGPTPMYDAIASALDYIKQGKHRKKVLVVVTDGENNHSSVTFKELMDRIRESDVLIYIVGLHQTMGAFRDAVQDRQRLKLLSETTGGYAYFPASMETCRQTMQVIVEEVSQHYTIGYYPTNSTHDGTWRKIRVAISKSDGDKMNYRVRTRSGYYAPQP